MADRLRHQRVELQTARDFVSVHHRHHTPPAGHMFSIGAFRGEELVGVVIVGRPVARRRDDGLTAEVTRLCVREGEPNACSFLYGKAARAALAMGYRRIGTYTLKTEPGTSLKAAGWVLIGDIRARSWKTPARLREDKTDVVQRQLWEAVA